MKTRGYSYTVSLNAEEAEMLDKIESETGENRSQIIKTALQYFAGSPMVERWKREFADRKRR